MKEQIFRILTVSIGLGVGVVANGEEWESFTLAGTGEKGFSGDGGRARKAQLNNPFGVIVGPDGGIYFCDTGNHVIRRIDRQSGVITTVAGTPEQSGYEGDGGPALKAKLFEPYEVRFDEAGNLFFVEMKNHVIRRVDSETGIISTVAGTGKQGFSGDGGPGVKAMMNRPHSIQFGPDGNLYICDIGNHRLRRLRVKDGIIETICGTGQREGPEDGAPISPQTSLKGPRAIDFDVQGNLWLALREGNAVFRLDLKAGTIHHVAGTGKKGFSGNGGPARKALLSGPKGIALDAEGNAYLADTESHTVRMIQNGKTPMLQLIGGDGMRGDGPDGPALQARMARLHGVFYDQERKEVLVGDSETHKIRLLRRRDPNVSGDPCPDC